MTKNINYIISNPGSLNSTIELTSPTVMPNSTGFLWNSRMMMQVNCRGYVNSQFMQPEPSKYSHGPGLDAKTFMQPEHKYFTHHPRRVFYIKDKLFGYLELEMPNFPITEIIIPLLDILPTNKQIIFRR